MNVIELENISNVRDLGGIPVEGGRVVKSGLLYRGSALFGASERDCITLFDELGISCVIDLRTGWEREAKPDVEVAKIEYLHIPFYDLEKVGIEYTEPAAGTKVIGRDVACNPDRFYRSLANPLTVGQMRMGIHAAFDRMLQKRPVYVHCSGGKDRAGIMTLLALTVMGARAEDIEKDYLFTNVARDKNYEKNFARFLRFANGDEQRARELVHNHRAQSENLVAFREAVEQRYGSMEDFVRNQIGIDDSLRAAIRLSCTEPR